MSKIIALILAGGSGTRIKSANMPKQYIPVAGKPIIIHTLSVFERHHEIDEIAVVCAGDDVAEMRRLVESFQIDKCNFFVPGGKTRQNSAYNGLAALRGFAENDAVILIHDAARPLVSAQTITDNIALAKKFGGATTAIASADTMLKSSDKKTVLETLNRDGLYAVQTPQSFVYKKILAAHEAAKKESTNNFTDDGGLYMHYAKTPLAIAEGSRFNFKITTDEDLQLFQVVCKNSCFEV
jgi:2-C-methyl-D-erythritol 4-phosphate cytidylyltransferase